MKHQIIVRYSNRADRSLPLTLLCDLLQLDAQPDKDQLSTSISIICSQNID